MEDGYFASEHNLTIKKIHLSKKPNDVQLDVMRTWFFSNFEDPANRTPWDSSEGGYLWIWGGPYNASYELMKEFFGVVSDKLIEELASELDSICWEWSSTERLDDYDESFIDDISKIGGFFNSFNNAIKDIKKLIELNIENSSRIYFHRLLYANVITSMETYLSDVFINLIISNPQLTRRFVELAPEFKKEKICLSEAYKTIDNMENKVKEYASYAESVGLRSGF